MGAFSITPELAAFLAGGNSMVIATRNRVLEPTATRASGVRVLDAHRLAVLLPRATCERALGDLEDNGELALCVCRPSDFHTVQLKGRCERVVAGDVDDVLLAEEQLRGFSATVETFGYTRAQARNLWLLDVWRVDMRVTEAYSQTPGKGAGGPLSGPTEGGSPRDA